MLWVGIKCFQPIIVVFHTVSDRRTVGDIHVENEDVSLNGQFLVQLTNQKRPYTYIRRRKVVGGGGVWWCGGGRVVVGRRVLKCCPIGRTIIC